MRKCKLFKKIKKEHSPRRARQLQDGLNLGIAKLKSIILLLHKIAHILGIIAMLKKVELLTT